MTYDDMTIEQRAALRQRVWGHLRARGELHVNTIARNLAITIENAAGALIAMSESGGTTFDESTNRWRANPRPK